MNKFIVEVPSDLHNRPCIEIIKFVQKKFEMIPGFSLQISIHGKTAEGNSIIGLSLLGVRSGDQIGVTIDAPEEMTPKIIEEFRTLLLQISLDPRLHNPFSGIIPMIRNTKRETEKSYFHRLNSHLEFLERMHSMLRETDGKNIPETTLDWIRNHTEISANYGNESDIGVDGINLLDTLRRCEGGINEHRYIIIIQLLEREIVRLQAKVGKLPDSHMKMIKENLAILQQLHDQIETITDKQSLEESCFSAYEKLIPNDAAKIWYAAGHQVRLCTIWSISQENPPTIDELKTSIKGAIEKYILTPTEEFIRATVRENQKKSLGES